MTSGPASAATVKSYAYDGGRPTSTTSLVAGKADAAAAQSLTWAPQGNVASIKTGPHNTTYGYDPDGTQIARVTNGTTTLYLGNDAIVLTGGVATQVVRQYQFPGGATAVRTATANASSTSSDALHYQMQDSQGTASTDVTADTLTTSRRGFTPFGESRDSSTFGTTFATGQLRGFLNAPLDTTNNLQTLGARQYDASLGQFLSIDPIFDAADPQSFNGFAYSDNDPVDKMDPAGTHLCSAGSVGNQCDGYLPDKHGHPGGPGKGAGANCWGYGCNGSSSSGGGGGGSAPAPRIDPNKIYIDTENKSGYFDPNMCRGMNQTSVGGDANVCQSHGRVLLSLYLATKQYEDQCGGQIIICSPELVGCVGKHSGVDCLKTAFDVGVLVCTVATDGVCGLARFAKSFKYAEESAGIVMYEGRGFSESEYNAASEMARRGNTVVLRTADPAAARTSDLLVNGKAYDVYTPTSGSVDNIVRNVAKKGSQVRGGGVVIDLSKSSLSPAELSNILPRVQGLTSQVSDVVVLP